MAVFMTAKDAERMMDSMGGKPFVVTFEKRTDGATRRMKVKNGVADATKGGSLAFDPASRGLRLVVDLDEMLKGNGWRMIPMDRVVSIQAA